MSIDYIEKLGVAIETEQTLSQTHYYVIYKDNSALFSHIEMDELRQKINVSMQKAVVYYSQNVNKNPIQMQLRQIEEASFKAVLHLLCMYNMWRQSYEQHKNHSLIVSQKDLCSTMASNACCDYCKKEFGTNYATYAAALMGLNPQAFVAYEKARRLFEER